MKKILYLLFSLLIFGTPAFAFNSVTDSLTVNNNLKAFIHKNTLSERVFHQKQDDEDDSEDKEFDIQLFSGTNIDPGNSNSVITNFSFEGLLKGKISEVFFFRLGGFSNRNIGRDSAAAAPSIRYIRVEPNKPLAIDTSKLIVQRYQLDSRLTTRSYGLYFNLMAKIFERPVDDGQLRIYASVSPEFIIRRRESQLSVINSNSSDTIVYNKALDEQRITTISDLVTTDKLFTPKYRLEEGYLNAGLVMEIIHSKYELFFFPSVSRVISRNVNSFVQGKILVNKYSTFNTKILLNAKLLGIQLGFDAKGILSRNSFYNFSIGIPVGLNMIKDRLENK